MNLKKATLMDGYPMLVANALVNIAIGHKVINFMND